MTSQIVNLNQNPEPLKSCEHSKSHSFVLNALTPRLNSEQARLHEHARVCAREFKRAEAKLLMAIEAVDRERVYLALGYASVFEYCVKELGLSEAVSYGLINVARKSREVPALMSKVKTGEITLSKAQKVVSVITKENQNHWLKLASTLSTRALEKQVAEANPKAAVREKVSYISAERIQMQIGVSEKLMLKLRRVQDLESQRLKRPVSLEEALDRMTGEYLQRHDPVERAERVIAKKGHLTQKAQSTQSMGTTQGAQTNNGAQSIQATQKTQAAQDMRNTQVTQQIQSTQDIETTKQSAMNSSREKCFEQSAQDNKNSHSEKNTLTTKNLKRDPIPTALKHAVQLRDQGQCTHVLLRKNIKTGKPDHGRCTQRRWLEVHHITPVSQGGTNTLDNLTTLCQTHHRQMHC